MALTLVSPGVSVSVINESFFIPASAPTVPLFFVATKANKLNQKGESAVGTTEANVVRTVTSRAQAMDLYGVPDFRRDVSGFAFHGDARNEYGLLALHQYLDVGSRAYVVRANIDLTDASITFMSLGTPVHLAGSTVFTGMGNGTIGSITAGGPQVRPQVITVTMTTENRFSVTGSVSGYIGAGDVNAAFSTAVVSFTVTSGSTAFAVGDRFTFQLAYAATRQPGMVGNGDVIGITAQSGTLAETITIRFTSPTAFNVIGSVSGALGSGTVGALHTNSRISFTVVEAATPIAFAINDEFTITATSQTITSPLGADDAQKRTAITTALAAAINSNTEIRSPLYEFNIVLCPGYPEVVDELNALVTSRAVQEEAIVLADTPADKTPEQVATWALTGERQRGNNVAYYYPWCLMSNIDGRDVMGAPSGTALRTIAYSDSVAYVWTAPAGASRGLVTGVSQVGYYTGTPGTRTTFVEVSLNEGQRDILYEYDKNINPIVFFPGRGLLVWGQKTSATAASALDRINVVRLVAYLRRSLRKGAVPFVFEPNDQITRDNLKAMADGLMSDILAKRGLMDFASFCDETNNTPDRIDRNELYLDIAIKPTKAAEFIYIPIRVVNTGADI